MEGQLVVAVVGVLCVMTLVLMVSWGLRVMNDIDELQNLPRGRYGTGRPAPKGDGVRRAHPSPWESRAS
ncbi:MAG TPA: hypothetical protein VFV02_11955 [Acidimicrobiales bacterium]|nr:hypothetical protein [Acidimicrobiales bacterium]